jgi:hypothetical protein
LQIYLFIAMTNAPATNAQLPACIPAELIPGTIIDPPPSPSPPTGPVFPSDVLQSSPEQLVLYSV